MHLRGIHSHNNNNIQADFFNNTGSASVKINLIKVSLDSRIGADLFLVNNLITIMFSVLDNVYIE